MSQNQKKRAWIPAREEEPCVVYKLIDINKEIDASGKTFRVGEKVYFVRELG